MFKQDYEIRIKFDIHGNATWSMLRKGEPAAVNKEEMIMAYEAFQEFADRIDEVHKCAKWRKQMVEMEERLSKKLSDMFKEAGCGEPTQEQLDWFNDDRNHFKLPLL